MTTSSASQGMEEDPSPISRENEIDHSLRKLADRIRATDEYLDNGVQLCEKVRLKLQEQVSQSKQPYSIAATHYAGSVGKRTDVVAPDFDLVFQINQGRPPFHDVVNFFQEKLQEHAKELKILPGSIQQTEINDVVQFCFTNGMEVDLLPATADMTSKQLNEKLKSLRQEKGYSSKYWIAFSSSFVKDQKGFMTQQSGFAHRTATLSKYWFKSLHFGESDRAISGGNTIFELLGVEAAMHVEDNEGEPMMKALTRVMDNMENIDKLKLSFKKNAKGDWVVMSKQDLLPEGKGQVSKLHNNNNITEPNISANNILKKMTPGVKQQFKELAGILKKRLTKLKDGQLGVEKVFEPLPGQVNLPLTDSIIPPVAYVTQVECVFVMREGEFPHEPATVIQNKNTTPEQMKLATVLTNRLVTTVINVEAALGYNPMTKAEQTKRSQMMVGAARDVIKTSFPGMMVNQEWKLKGMKMKNFDAVVTVPYREGDGRCVMVGVAWSPKALAHVDKNNFY